MSPETVTRLVILGAVLALVAFLLARKYDPDPGGYADGFRTSASFSDKLVHGIASMALCFVLFLWMPIEWAFGVTIAVGVAWEVGQGFISRYDIAADIAGAAMTVALLVLRARGLS